MANEGHFATLELKLVLIQFDTLCPAPVQEVLQVVVVILISLFVSVPLIDNEEVISILFTLLRLSRHWSSFCLIHSGTGLIPYGMRSHRYLPHAVWKVVSLLEVSSN